MKSFIKNIYVFILIFILLFCCGCHKISGNQPHYYFKAFDYQNNNIVDAVSDDKEIFSGGTAPRYGFDCDDEFADLKNQVLSLDLGTDTSIIYAIAVEYNNQIFGVCNRYKDSIGYLSGGGNYGVEEIDSFVFFEYKDSQLNIITTIDNACCVSFNKNILTYWKNKKYYYYDTTNSKEEFLFDDCAYDIGLQHQSYTNVYFNKNYTHYILNKAKMFSDKKTEYVFNFNDFSLTKIGE